MHAYAQPMVQGREDVVKASEVHDAACWASGRSTVATPDVVDVVDVVEVVALVEVAVVAVAVVVVGADVETGGDVELVVVGRDALGEVVLVANVVVDDASDAGGSV